MNLLITSLLAVSLASTYADANTPLKPLTTDEKIILTAHAISTPCSHIIEAEEVNLVIVISGLIQEEWILFRYTDEWTAFINQQKADCAENPRLPFYHLIAKKQFL